MNSIKKDFNEALELLSKFINSSGNLEMIEKSGQIMVNALIAGNKIISCGNGGSMSDAMHFAEELTAATVKTDHQYQQYPFLIRRIFPV